MKQILTIDKNDTHVLKSKQNRKNEIYNEWQLESDAFFWNAYGEKMPLINMYKGRSAFIVAGGTSFAELNTELLKKPGIWTITLNNAVRSFRGNAACIVDDPSRFVASLWLDPSITKFVPLACLDRKIWDNRTLIEKDGTRIDNWCPVRTYVRDCPNVVAYRRNEKFHAPRFLQENTINWGCHKNWGGGRSVLLATLRILYLLGFKNVYLLGVDFEMNEDKKYHFEEARHEGAIKNNMSTYSKMIQWFRELRPYFEASNFIVKNCNFNSKLDAFDFISFADAIYEASYEVGDTLNERTYGMYTPVEDKIREWQVSRKNKQEDS